MAKKPKYNVILRDKDLRRDTFRSGGPGGQAQNKLETGVRYTHIPTGVAAESRSERSQDANDQNALASLKDKLLRLWMLKRGMSAKEAWERKPDIAFGAKMRSYVLAGNAQRVEDHETGWTGNPRAVLNGDIDDLLRTRLIQAAKEEWTREEKAE